jgi:hypothetical protein
VDMTCQGCDGFILMCGACHSEGCPKAVCGRCALAQPDLHVLSVPELAPLGTPVSLLDW